MDQPPPDPCLPSLPTVDASQSGDTRLGDNAQVHGPVAGRDVNIYPPPPLPSPDALHQLRSPVSDFVGRTAEFKRLLNALRPTDASANTSALIGSIHGLGGIGKTQLAYRVAAHLAADFPDAQILLALRGAAADPQTPGVAANPVTPEAALATAIRAFEPDRPLPAEREDLERIYRSLLYGKHVLVLADDAHDRAQVAPLLPPPGSMLLVTSRWHFVLPAATVANLETLVQIEAEQLLARICPRIGPLVGRLAVLCGCLPLALRVSATLLQNYPDRRNERTRLAVCRRKAVRRECGTLGP